MIPISNINNSDFNNSNNNDFGDFKGFETGKYSKALTVSIIVIVIVLIGVGCFAAYEAIKRNSVDRDSLQAIEEFDENLAKNRSAKLSDGESSVNNNSDSKVLQYDEDSLNSPSGSGGYGSVKSTKTYYKDFIMIGHIDIPKINCKYPILGVHTTKALETAITVLSPSNAKLNVPGNVVLAGHNYRNNLFFGQVHKLVEGDKIYITDEDGNKLTYTVYEKFVTTPEDSEYITRDRNGATEISLSTCTDDSQNRTIVLARAEQ